jgi:hypothetical protein
VAAAGDPFLLVGYVLIASLAALAVIEHWFMILPIPAETLWRWSLKASESPSAPRVATSTPRSASRSGTGSEDPITSLPDH